MSIERALIARAKPYVLAARLDEILSLEVCKGCLPDISNHPVKLEPNFIPANELNKEPAAIEEPITVPAEQLEPDQYMRMQAWVSPKHHLQWIRAERFVRLLNQVKWRLGFEIIGNEQNIRICFLVHKDDLNILEVALKGEYTLAALSMVADDTERSPSKVQKILFQDFFPAPPYIRRFTQSDQLSISPYEPLVNALAALPATAYGFVQVLFEPARHNWHQNVEVLTDLEFMSKLMGDIRSPYRYSQQAPSGDLRNMAHDTQVKAHNDKPFYFATLRVGLLCSNNLETGINAISSFARLFQQGGRPLNSLTENDYHQHLRPEIINEMFLAGNVYRPGFLLNSSELASLVHLPSMAIFEENSTPIRMLETLPPQSLEETTGIIIGKSEVAGIEKDMKIPSNLRPRSIHIIGNPGSGKSCAMEHMVLQDVKANEGVAVIDPHNDLVEKLLFNIPKEFAHKTIYLDFGDPDWIPIWNPLKRAVWQNAYRITDELVSALKNIVELHHWGDRLEHLLRHGIYGLLHLPGSTLQNLSNLLEPYKKGNEADRNRLKQKILAVIESESARKFWRKDYDSYRREDFAPAQHKLSKLLMSDETVYMMLNQPDSLLDFQQIMEEEKVILINLSSIGPDARGILGCFILSIFHLAALARSKINTLDRKPFHIYCDEAHKVSTISLENTLAETRKYEVSLTLAHQYLRQFKNVQRDALSAVGATIIFNVDASDARYLVKDLKGKVEPKDLFDLGVGEAITRVDKEIVRIKTCKPLGMPEGSCREQIIQQSRQQYYRHISTLCKKRQWYDNDPVSEYAGRGNMPQDQENSRAEEFIYEEFT